MDQPIAILLDPAKIDPRAQIGQNGTGIRLDAEIRRPAIQMIAAAIAPAAARPPYGTIGRADKEGSETQRDIVQCALNGTGQAGQRHTGIGNDPVSRRPFELLSLLPTGNEPWPVFLPAWQSSQHSATDMIRGNLHRPVRLETRLII